MQLHTKKQFTIIVIRRSPQAMEAEVITMANDREHLVPKAESALDKLKYEVAAELGLDDDIQRRGWGNMTTREVGKIGGNMVKRMIRFAEQAMAGEGGRDVQSGKR